MSIVDAFINAIIFLNGMRDEGIINDYALIGGLALSAWIRPRTTRDVDLAVVVSEKITWADMGSIIKTRLQKRVSMHKATQRTTIKEKLSFMSGHIEIDMIGTKDFDLAAEAIKNAVVVEIFKKKVKVVTPEYLILLKLLPLSSQDEVDIKALIKRADMDKVKSLAQRHYLLPKLEALLLKRKQAKK